jgi:hypothetical protein
MVEILHSNKNQHIYNGYDFTHSNIDMAFLQNKLFCTFTQLENLDLLLENLQSSYTILYNKMFVLYIQDNNEYACTYNVEQGNVNSIPDNTILVHRKKESNSLYTINALNELIKSLNSGILDFNYKINWNDYQNSILLTQQGTLKKLDTKIYKIVNL